VTTRGPDETAVAAGATADVTTNATSHVPDRPTSRSGSRDPCRYLLATLWLALAAVKAVRPHDFTRFVHDALFAPAPLATGLAGLVILVEASLGALALWTAKARLAAHMTLVLATAYGAFALFASSDSSCGCFGRATPDRDSRLFVSFVLIFLALGSLTSPANRPIRNSGMGGNQ